MILTIIENFWNFFLFFFCVILPIAFIYGLFHVPAASITHTEPHISISLKEQERVTPDFYQTVKKEAGSYEVRGPNNSLAIVIKVEYPNEGTYWVASHAAKNGKTADRVKTKKEAVAAAIELLKAA